MLMFSLAFMFSCKSKDVKPDVRTMLTSKWWCHDKKLLNDLNFNSDGAVQERYEGKVETGRWTLSSDEKTIEIIQVGGNNNGTRTFGLEQLTDEQLILTFFGAENTYSKCE
ncbi:hypothetical protein GCM10007390_19160 [Persicitalea jodogahamensis]|uniref:Uncharacterized protein n=2 Tax=Persicitalea jodogahamensis TaxID=402147 RepID=A0A8J3D808_9BACT|nr:hypothetical protein GCM10007390_19160 [Persicitalea jodogahamensis]